MCQEFTAENQGDQNSTMFEFQCNGECAEADVTFWFRFDVSPGISSGMSISRVLPSHPPCLDQVRSSLLAFGVAPLKDYACYQWKGSSSKCRQTGSKLI